MSDNSETTLPNDATAEQGAVAVPAASEDKPPDDPLGFLDPAAKRQFSESEVSQSITVKFLVEKVRELRVESSYLKSFEAKYYETDKELQIERNKTKLGKVQEIVSVSLVAIGGAGMGLSLKFFDTSASVSSAAFLLFAGIVASGVYLKIGSR
jgi:hypothetical protein